MRRTECDGVDVLVEDEGAGDHEVEDREALGAQVEGQDLDGVGDDERAVRDTRSEVRARPSSVWERKLTHKPRRTGR